MSKKNPLHSAESIEEAIHDNRMFAERTFYCIANGVVNCFHSSLTIL